MIYRLVAVLLLMALPAAAGILQMRTSAGPPPPSNCTFTMTGGVTHFVAGSTLLKC